MRIYEIFFSPTGGTKKVSDILSSVWNCEKVKIDLCDINTDFSEYEIGAEDMCIISVPSYGGRVPITAAERIRLIRGNGAKACIVCVYGNRAYEDTLIELKDCVEEKGFNVISAVAAVAEHSIMRKFAAGRPDDEDKNELINFALKIKEKAQSGNLDSFNVPGNHTYKELKLIPMFPEPNKKCTLCGACREKCPVNAIREDNSTDKNKCISCMRCVSLCPIGARDFNKAVISAMEMKMAKAFEGRKKNELFL